MTVFNTIIVIDPLLHQCSKYVHVLISMRPFDCIGLVVSVENECVNIGAIYNITNGTCKDQISISL